MLDLGLTARLFTRDGIWNPEEMAKVWKLTGRLLKDPSLELTIDDLIRLKMTVAELVLFSIDVDYLITTMGFRAEHFKLFPSISLDDWASGLGLTTEHLNGPLQMPKEEYNELAAKCRWNLEHLSPQVKNAIKPAGKLRL